MNKILSAILVCMLTAIIAPKFLAQSVDVIEVPLSGIAYGFTVCNGENPIVVLRTGLVTEVKAVVTEHEKIHARQIRKFGKCSDFYKKFQLSGDFRFKMELEAYCPNARTQLERNLSVHFVTETLLKHLISYTRPEMSEAEARTLVAFCLS